MQPRVLQLSSIKSDQSSRRCTSGNQLEPAAPLSAEVLVSWHDVGAGQLLQGIKRVVAPLVALLYLAPLLVLARLAGAALPVLRRPLDWAVVGFVVLVVLVFGLCVAAVVLFIIAGPKARRKMRPVLRQGLTLNQAIAELGLEQPTPTSPEKLQNSCAANPGTPLRPLRLQGTVVALESASQDEPVASEGHLVGEDEVQRLQGIRLFGVAAEVPLVVDPCAQLVLIGKGGSSTELLLSAQQRSSLRAELQRQELEQLSRTSHTRLHAGDTVELACYEADVVDLDQLTLANQSVRWPTEQAGAPYRREALRRGILLSGKRKPLLIQRS